MEYKFSKEGAHAIHCLPCLISLFVNFAITQRGRYSEAPARRELIASPSSHGNSADLHGDARVQRAALSTVTVILICIHTPGTPAILDSSSGAHAATRREQYVLALRACVRARAPSAPSRVRTTSSVTFTHNKVYPLWILLFSRFPFDFILANETVRGERQVNNQSL